jgi:hypothetical protein
MTRGGDHIGAVAQDPFGVARVPDGQRASIEL